MAGRKDKDTFGLDQNILENFDWESCGLHVSSDVKSDFIIAPHFSYILNKAFDNVAEFLTQYLKSGRYAPNLPISIDVPKTAKVSTRGTDRAGINFTRSGSILYPIDRAFYQILADTAHVHTENQIDRERCFSHQPSEEKEKMFKESRSSWREMRESMKKTSSYRNKNVVLKLDISSYFSNINHHTLANYLESSGYPKPLTESLHSFLWRVTGERSSRGLIQGVYPSDLFGNFFLSILDDFLKEKDISSFRYVDDIYCFFKNFDEAERAFVEINAKIRGLGLSLNESKTVIQTVQYLSTSEPDLEEMFESAAKEIAEVTSNFPMIVVDADYGFQAIWDDDDEGVEPEDVELEATENLFEEISNHPLHSDEIERFCLPIFSKFKSEYGVEHVLRKLHREPAMTQVYAQYLSNFVYEENISDYIEKLICDGRVTFEWQYLWLFAALLKGDRESNNVRRRAREIAEDANVHEVVRAMAVIYLGRFGTYPQRKGLFEIYKSTTSQYLQSSILFSARYFGGAERRNAISNWGGHSDTHKLLVKAMERD